jgi:hypothetical protein
MANVFEDQEKVITTPKYPVVGTHWTKPPPVGQNRI